MAERTGGARTAATETTVAGADWSRKDTSGETHTRVAFVDLDLTEVESSSTVFTECTFRRARFNASIHTDGAFLNCTFINCNFFDARFTDCKFVGSKFERCTFEITKVVGGNWSLVGLPGADLRSAAFERVRMREADLTGAKCQGSSFRDVDLAGASLERADFSECDLRGSDLSSLDPETAEIRGAIITLDQAIVIATALGLDIRRDESDD